MTRLILDDNDDQLHQVITMGMTMDLTHLDKQLPGISQLPGVLAELALRIREIRRLATCEFRDFDGDHWVRSSEILRIIDE